MKEYFFHLAGLQVVLRTPHEITISERLQPFLCDPAPEIHCVIALQAREALPVFGENGVWYGAKYYDCHNGVRRIFHCHENEADAFAVTQFFCHGNVEISVLPECLSYFTGSGGIFNRIGLETLLLQHQGLLLHASLIKYKNKAIAFAGPSGVGKSTQGELWRNFLGASVLNGDRAVLRKSESGWIAYGSPYAGTSGIYKNDYAPLEAIVILRQAEENHLRRLTSTEAFRLIYPELSIHQWEKDFVAQATDLCLQLLAETPVYLLECRPEESAAQLVKKGLGL